MDVHVEPGGGTCPSPHSLPALEAIDAGRRFGDVVALDGVTLRVLPGEIRALLGPNGAGKTTLIRLLAGLAAPTRGTVRVSGLATGDRATRQRVGFVPSGDRTFYLRLSGLENLAFFARLHGYRNGRARLRAQELLDVVGLGPASRRPVGLYSHGMQKRLSVARALLGSPSVLLVDEATHDLDAEGSHRVRGLVRDLADAGTAVLWATQRIEEIRGFADTVTVLGRGAVRFDGTVPELLARSPANGTGVPGHPGPELEEAVLALTAEAVRT